MSYLDNVIKGILNREGGFVNHPADKGGPTKYGITQATLSGWRKKRVTLRDVKDLTIEEASQIYKKLYVEAPGFLKFHDDTLAEQLIDAGVNHGTRRAVMLLQKAVGAVGDGIIGPRTVKSVSALQPHVVYLKFMAQRLRYFANILKNDSKQLVLAAGWMNRCALMLEIYVRAVMIEKKHEVALWNTAVFLREEQSSAHRGLPARRCARSQAT